MAKRRQNPVDRTDSRVAALVALYVQAEAEITRLVVETVMSGKSVRSRRFRHQKRAAVARLVRELEKQAVPQAAVVIKSAYAAGETEARRVLDAKPVSRERQKAIDLLTDQLQGSLKDMTVTLGRQVDDIFRKETLRVARESKLDDSDVAQRRLASRLSKQGVTAFVDKSGRRWKLDTYARMAVQSASREALNLGTVTTMTARGFDLVEINSVRNPSKICKPHEGKVYSISGDHPTYPKLDPVPPFHPGPCRHYASPSKLAIADRRRRQAA